MLAHMTYWRNGLTIIILSLNYHNICYGLKGEYNVSSLQTILRGDETLFVFKNISYLVIITGKFCLSENRYTYRKLLSYIFT